jgi:hypothetical protein
VATLRLEDIQKAWARDSCGLGARDSIITILEKNKTLYAMPEQAIYVLLGNPLYTNVYKRGKIITYLVIGTCNSKLKCCDPQIVPKTLEIAFDSNHKVDYYRTWEE